MVRTRAPGQPRYRGVRRWVPLLASLLAVTGCRGDGTGTPAAGRSPAEVPAVSTIPVPPELAGSSTALPVTSPVAPSAAPSDDLAAATAIAPLDGFAELPAGAGVGPLDLAAASAGDPRERDALSRFGFRDGYARGFVSGGEEIAVTVLRFSSPAEADAYLQDTIESSLVSNGSFLFPVPVPGSTGYREQGVGKEGEPFVTYGAIFVRGDRCFEQLVRSPAAGPERSEADVHVLAGRQADRVGG